ncbi:carboxypeptidase-like regulatory domain-containing protein [Ekhidna sp.]|uniref:TonB-dependent receptor n=1 Tax=Ekhidna sp. TaxID=2608089 RepID=UPI00329793AC
MVYIRQVRGFLFILSLVLGYALSAQQGNGFSFISLLDSLEENTDYEIFYKNQWIEKVTYERHVGSITELLNQISNENGLSVIYRGRYIILIPKNPMLFVDEKNLIDQYGDNVIVIDSEPTDNKYCEVTFRTVNGTDQSPLIGVQVYIEELGEGGVSDENGEVKLLLLPGLYTVKSSYLGFNESEVMVLAKSNGEANIDLFESLTQLDEVTVSGSRVEENVEGAKMGTNTISMEIVKKLPSLYGEVDVIKSVILLPGVSTGGEGTQGFNVRGSDSDQNLLLLDGSTIYNSSHLFGFFSNINSEVIGSATLYKSGIPAYFGERASSVFDITTKEPSYTKRSIGLGVGLISSKISAEFPLIENKSSLLVAGRISYTSWILRKQKNIQVRDSEGRFNDFNVKWSTRLGSSNKVSISGYRSFDEFKFRSDTSYSWISTSINLNWDHFFNPEVSTRLIAGVSEYSFLINGEAPNLNYRLKNGIEDRSLEGKLFWEPSTDIKLTAGYKFSDQSISPGTFEQRDEALLAVETPQDERLRIHAVYAHNQHELSNDRVSLEYGLRLNLYQYLGDREVGIYDQSRSRTPQSLESTRSYSSGEVIAQAFNLEPRLSLGYKLNSQNSVKLSYNRMHQYIHSLSNSSSITPIEIWKASDTFYEPFRNDQVSVGLFRNSKTGMYETSFEIYYRKIHNLIDYKNATTVFLNSYPEQAILSGDGRAKGAELLVKKVKGRLVGWLSYSLSKTEKRIQGTFGDETINDGKYYPSENDRPHKFVLATNYQLDKRLQLGMNFTYNSGIPFTGPDVKYISNGVLVTHFAERNQYRIPDYHRLDISLTLEESNKKDKKLKGRWILSFYNVYGRRNAYSVFIGERATSSPTAYKLSVLGRMFPSISYNLRIN